MQPPLHADRRTGAAGEVTFSVLRRTAGDIMLATLVLVAVLVAIGRAIKPEVRFRQGLAAVVCFGTAWRKVRAGMCRREAQPSMTSRMMHRFRAGHR